MLVQKPQGKCSIDTIHGFKTVIKYINQGHWVLFGILLCLQLRSISTQSSNIPGDASGTSFSSHSWEATWKEPCKKMDQKLHLQYPQIKGKILPGASSRLFFNTAPLTGQLRHVCPSQMQRT